MYCLASTQTPLNESVITSFFSAEDEIGKSSLGCSPLCCPVPLHHLANLKLGQEMQRLSVPRFTGQCAALMGRRTQTLASLDEQGFGLFHIQHVVHLTEAVTDVSP